MDRDDYQRPEAGRRDFRGGKRSIQSKDPVTKRICTPSVSPAQPHAGRRLTLLRHLELPERLSANGLLDVLNVLYT